MSSSLVAYVVVLAVVVGAHVHAVPLEMTNEAAGNAAGENVTNAATAATPAPTPTSAAAANAGEAGAAAAADLEPAAAEHKEPTYADAAGKQVVSPEVAGTAASHNFDPAAASSIYAGLLTPDALQQYVNQFGAAYAPYAAYPAPVGYGPAPPPAPAPIYPGPYVVQTGYEGYLVPATADTAPSSTSSAVTEAPSNSPANNNPLLYPFTLLSDMFPVLMMSTLFRVLATLATAIGMVFFGGAITTAICNLTPICDISFKAVSYLRNGGNAEHVGRMVAEGMTPERVRRATEFVRNAIRKYRQLQQLAGDEGSD